MKPRKFAFEDIPSCSTFFSSVECKNVPAVFTGCVNHWLATSKWNPANGGLEYFLERAGCNFVDAILSKHAPTFYGNIGSHERVRIPFSKFIGFCKQRIEKNIIVADPCTDDFLDSSEEIYLAQVPIMNVENRDDGQLGILMEDIQKLDLLGNTQLTSINFWMNNSRVRSSTHYDPYHNILCVVTGRKEVVLWPPSASPYLYPYPICGEASNHSSLSLENPDYTLYPRAKSSMEYSHRVSLFAGDALFIPEGWFHQVDSEDLTIAVNFWWKSYIMSNMLEYMDGYYLRIILRRMTEKEMELVIGKEDSSTLNHLGCTYDCEALAGKVTKDGEPSKPDDDDPKLGHMRMNEVDPCCLDALQLLVGLVHQRFENSHPIGFSQCSVSNSSSEKNECGESIASLVEHDDVSKFLWNLSTRKFKIVIQTMALNFPRTLEALVVHLLSPMGAEVLTRKFDDLDKRLSKEERDKFYDDFHAAFGDRFTAMNVILARKEQFAAKVFQNVVEKYVGNTSHKRAV